MPRRNTMVKTKRLAILLIGITCWATTQPSTRGQENLSASEAESIVAEELQIETAAELRIRKALQSQTQIDFIETPLIDVVAFLEELHNVQIEIDAAALGAVGLGSDTPLTRDLKGISLSSALNLMLSEMELTYVIRNEVLWITTLERAELTPATRVYGVKDLLEGDRTAEQLIEAVTIGWRIGDYSPGDAVAFGDRLIVRAPQSQQDNVARILTMLRATHDGKPGSLQNSLGLYPVANMSALADEPASAREKKETRMDDRGSFRASPAATTKQDPFGGGGEDPFADPKHPSGAGGEDPFGGGDDPFGKPQDPFGGGDDPFGKPADAIEKPKSNIPNATCSVTKVAT